MKKLILILLSLTLFSRCTTEETKKPQPPNIIFLLTDDQRWDTMGCMGNSDVITPEMDRLAGEGVLFSNAYVTTPICAVSRASILSGQYARRHQINGFRTHFSDSAYQFTYPIQLKKAGYRIGFVGKYGIGNEEDFPKDQYDFWDCFPGWGDYWHKDSLGNDMHLTKMLGDGALKFLKNSSDDKPFCLSVSFKAPHSQDGDPNQFLFDSTYIAKYQHKIFSMPKTADSLHWDKFSTSFKNNNLARIRWEIRFGNTEKYQHSLRGYHRLIYGVDVQIGRIRKMLKETGKDKNTIIMLMGDNGFYLAEHGMAGKWYIHEESIRVPFIIYDPRAPNKHKGLINDKMVLNIDVAPTIIDYAGINVPEVMQGENVRDIMYQEDTSWREDFLFEHPYVYEKIPRSEGLVTKEWKYVQFYDRELGYEWMFHTSDDPNEKENLAEDEKYTEIKAKLKKRYKVLAQQYK